MQIISKTIENFSTSCLTCVVCRKHRATRYIELNVYNNPDVTTIRGVVCLSCSYLDDESLFETFQKR